MRRRIVSGASMFLLALALAGLSAVADTGRLDKGQVNSHLRASEKALKKLESAQQKNNMAEATAHARAYAQHLERAEQALAQRAVRESDVLDVADRVDEATLKHIPVLTRVLNKVPAEARPAIEHALEVSRRGHQTATQAILSRGAVEWQGRLDDRTAREAMRRNEYLVRLAERSRRRGDAATERESIERYAANMGRINDALERDWLEPGDAGTVLERVRTNTQRHLSVLERLLGQVPEQARPALERAIASSQRGHQTATQAIAARPAAGVAAGRPSGVPPAVGGGPAGPPSGEPVVRRVRVGPRAESPPAFPNQWNRGRMRPLFFVCRCWFPAGMTHWQIRILCWSEGWSIILLLHDARNPTRSAACLYRIASGRPGSTPPSTTAWIATR